MKTITAFQTVDGKVFTDQSEADNHEFSLKFLQQIDEFVESGTSPYPSNPHRSMMERTIVAWEKFKNEVK